MVSDNSLQAEERDRVSHPCGDVCAEVRDLVVVLREKGEAGPPARHCKMKTSVRWTYKNSPGRVVRRSPIGAVVGGLKPACGRRAFGRGNA